MTRETNRLTILQLGLAAWLIVGIATQSEAAAGTKVSWDGVTAYASDSPMTGDIEAIEKAAWDVVPPEKLPREFTGSLMLVSKRIVVGLSPESDLVALSVFTRGKNQLNLRGRTRFDVGNGAARLKLLAEEKQPGLSVEVRGSDHGPVHRVSLSADGILKMDWPADRNLLWWTRIDYAILPSLVGTDLVYDPRTHPDLTDFHLPSTNMVVGLMDEGNCMMVGVCPPSKQQSSTTSASLRMDKAGTLQRSIASLSLNTAGRTFYLIQIGEI